MLILNKIKNMFQKHFSVTVFKYAKKIFLFLNILYIPFTVNAVDAVNLTPPGIGINNTVVETPNFMAYLDWLYKVMLGSTGLLALIIIVAGGVMYIFAGASGNPQNTSKAKTMILSAIFGLLLALGSWIILNTINPDLLRKGLNLSQY